MFLRIRLMFQAIRHYFTADERKLQQQFDAFRTVSAEVVDSKQKLDQAIAHNHNEDQFQDFAEGARTSRF